jgi:hypothetical protein
MKVFSKDMFIGREGHDIYKFSKDWVDKCDRKPVINSHCGDYVISDSWCIDVPDAVNCKCVVKTREWQKGEKKMYTMKDFKEKRIAVRVGKEHMTEFLRMCEAEGMRWGDNDNPTAFNPIAAFPGRVNDDTCVTVHCKYGNGYMTWGSKQEYEKQGLTIVDFKEFATQTTKPRYKITIECDGTTTTARMEINGKEVKIAQAKRNPADKFSWRVGAETAFGRLFFKKQGEKKERPFKVGDRVVCVKDTECHKESVRGKHGIIRVIGDYVKCVGVEFDEDVCGHRLDADGVLCEYGHGWYLKASDLRHE